jgi:tetratricopeptide (TPR) repeat protein
MFSPFLAVQGGVKLKGGNPMLTLGTTIDLASISFVVNYNIDLTNSLDALDKFSISAKFNLGDQGRAQAQGDIEKIYLDGIELYANGQLEEAIKKWENVLELNPKFTPAHDFIEIAKKALKLKKDIVNNQKLD